MLSHGNVILVGVLGGGGVGLVALGIAGYFVRNDLQRRRDRATPATDNQTARSTMQAMSSERKENTKAMQHELDQIQPVREFYAASPRNC